MSLVSTSAIELIGQLNRGDVSPSGLTEASLQAIAAQDSNIRAFLSTNADAALAQAEAIAQSNDKVLPGIVGKFVVRL